MKSVHIVAWVLKISGGLYILISIPFIIYRIRFIWPQDWNAVLLMLASPSNLATALVHGLGAIAIGIILDRLQDLRASLKSK